METRWCELHVIERYSRPDLGHLNPDVSLDDPKDFTKPDTFKRVFTLRSTSARRSSTVDNVV